MSEKELLQICPQARRCGGCQLQNMTYDEQLEWKQRLVRRLTGRFCPAEPIIGMDEPYHYRTKVQAAFVTDSRKKIISGVYQSGTHRVVPVDLCLLEDKTADSVIVTIRRMLPKFGLTTYDERTGRGFLRHVLIRKGYSSGQVLVVLVTGTPVFPSKNAFVAELVRRHPEITSIVQNINRSRTSLVLGDQEKVLFGKGTIEDTMCNLSFRISPRSFYQVNPKQTEVLYNKAIEFADFSGNERVLDAYCGVGTIGLIASPHVGEVVGVELNRDAVRDAVANAKRNSIKNVWFTCADAGDYMRGLADEGEKVDVVLMDPPRAGASMEFLYSLMTLSPDKVIYVSCNPETLARDLEVLSNGGYTIRKIQPVDMFPHTNHIECVTLLTKGKS